MGIGKKKATYKKGGGWLLLFGVIALLCFFVSRYFCQLMLIQGASMEPSYQNGQFVLLNKWDRHYDVGDVIAFRCEALQAVLVKRIAPAPEEKTEMLSVSDGYYVLGDNLEKSVDSRNAEVGIVHDEDIIGKIWFPK